MPGALFVNIPARGHVNPTLPVVRELVARGEPVTYCLPAEDEALIRPTGARFRPIANLLPEIRSRQGGATPLSELPAAIIRGATRVLPELLELARAENPGYVVYDAYCVAGRFLAQLLDLPAVATYATYGFTEQALVSGAFGGLSDAGSVQRSLAGYPEAVAELSARFDIAPPSLFDLLVHAEPLNIVFLPREFHPAGDTFDERWVFVGPSLPRLGDGGGFPFERLAGGPVAYVSLGTVYNERPEFFQTCVDAFRGSPWRVAISTGDWVNPQQLGRLPDNVVVWRWVPQLEMLAHAHLFVTHGGMNSTMEAIANAVPLVVVPQQAEQVLTARRVAELGLGRHLAPADVAAETLLSAANALVADREVANRLARMRDAALAGGGYRKAAEEILKFAAALG